MRYSVWLFLLGLLFSVPACGSQAPTKEVLLTPIPIGPSISIQRGILDPYIEISTASGVGSGTIIVLGKNYYVLTAGHVVDGSKTVTLKKELEHGFSYKTWIGDVVAQDYSNELWTDLGLVKPRNQQGLAPARFSGLVQLQSGQDAWFVGTNGGLHEMLEKTIISRQTNFNPRFWGVRGEEVVAPRVAFNGNVWYGNSGGGLYVMDNSQYTLVGVVVELARRGEKSPGMAITQKTIQEFLYRFQNDPDSLKPKPKKVIPNPNPDNPDVPDGADPDNASHKGRPRLGGSGPG